MRICWGRPFKCCEAIQHTLVLLALNSYPRNMIQAVANTVRTIANTHLGTHLHDVRLKSSSLSECGEHQRKSKKSCFSRDERVLLRYCSYDSRIVSRRKWRACTCKLLPRYWSVRRDLRASPQKASRPCNDLNTKPPPNLRAKINHAAIDRAASRKPSPWILM